MPNRKDDRPDGRRQKEILSDAPSLILELSAAFAGHQTMIEKKQ
jgi:hypothetical protein